MAHHLPIDVLVNQLTHQLGLKNVRRYLNQELGLPTELQTDDDIAFELRRPGSKLQQTVNTALTRYAVILQLRYETELQNAITYYQKEVRRVQGEIEYAEKQGKTKQLSPELRAPTLQAVQNKQFAVERLTTQLSLLSLQLLAQPQAFYAARTAEYDLAVVGTIKNLRNFIEQTFGSAPEYATVKVAMLTHLAECEARYQYTAAQTPEMIAARLLASQQFAVVTPSNAIVPPAPKYTGRKETLAEEHQRQSKRDLPMLTPEVFATHVAVSQLLMRELHMVHMQLGLKKAASQIKDPLMRNAFMQGVQTHTFEINSQHQDIMRAFEEKMVVQTGYFTKLNKIRIHHAAEAEIVKNRVGYGMHTPPHTPNRPLNTKNTRRS